MTISERNDSETPPWAAGTEGRHEELYPLLDVAEVDLIARYGERVAFDAGATLWDYGDPLAGMYLVVEGRLDIVRRDRHGREFVIVSHGPGGYSGETVTMTGGSALVAGRAGTDVVAVRLDAESVRRLIATEADLGEKILLSFILRRMRMIAENLGNVTLIGHADEPATQTLRSFCSRNGLPYEFVDPARSPRESSRLLAERGVSGEPLPILFHNDRTLIEPTTREVAEAFGFTTPLGENRLVDVAVVGAGPAGLAAAVYAASEGLSVVVIEAIAPGGQAGSSSKIENYLGFPTGISGQALAGRAFLQAQKFGARMALAREAERLLSGDDEHRIAVDGDGEVRARTVVIATGAVYRQPPIEGLEQFSGVHYGASHVEGEICRGRDVAIVGGGNSAGQAAVYLSRRARIVHMLVRGPGLEHSMSEYLIRRIEQIPNIRLHTRTEVERVIGQGGRIYALALRHSDGRDPTRLDVSQLFIFIGARPGTDFLNDAIALDDKGFVLTGDQLSQAQLNERGWPLERRPYLLETSVPGIFAAGDVRAGSVKRVASAVGEGSVCIQFIHRILSGEDRRHRGSKMSTTGFSDKAHSVAELVFQGVDELNPDDRLDDEMLQALSDWRSRPDTTDAAAELLQRADNLGFVISYRGESTGHWPREESTTLTEAMVRDFLFDGGICNVESDAVKLYAVRFQLMATRDTEYLLACPFVTEAGNIGGLTVVCVSKRLHDQRRNN